jgi:hypothetical protein
MVKKKKRFIWVEKTVYKNKKNGQYSIPLPKKALEGLYKEGKVPKKIRFKLFK